MVTKVYLIRHGETEDADARRYKGHLDVPLSGRGVEQIKQLTSYMVRNCSGLLNEARCGANKEQDTLDAVYTSTLGRAIESAEIIARPFGLTPLVVEGLKERNFGLWEGMTFDEIREKWPEAFTAWADNPVQFSPKEGESTLEVKERALKAFNGITQRHGGEAIAIISHGGIIRIILCELLGMPLENIFRIEQDFAALNVIELWDYPVIKQINYVVTGRLNEIP